MHVYIKIDNKELLKTLKDIEGVEVVDVERELTEKEKLDKESGPEGDIVQGEGYVVTDRNSLLEKLKKMDK